MGLDLWFRADVARILQATQETMDTTADMLESEVGKTERAAGYRQGFGAALRAVATAFGLNEQRAGYVIEGIRGHPLP